MTNELNADVGGAASYAEQLQAPQHTRLKAFFREPPTRQWRRHHASDLYVIDCLDSQVITSSNRVPFRGGIRRDFIEALELLPQTSRCRFIFWQVGDNASINKASLDYIALKYNLDPYFLSAHLAQGRRARMYPELGFNQALPTQRKYIQLVFGSSSCLTITWATEETGQPVRR